MEIHSAEIKNNVLPSKATSPIASQSNNDYSSQVNTFLPSLAEALGIERGVSAIIGSGGKTSLLTALSLELSKKGRVILTTSTHIFPFPHCENILFCAIAENETNAKAFPCTSIPENASVKTILFQHSDKEEDLKEKVLSLWNPKENPILCLGSPGEKGKLSPPPLSFRTLEGMADFVLVEADGSKRLPGKAHGKNEPQIPKESKRTILLFGATALHKPISEVIHRVEIFQSFFTPALREDTLLTKELLLQAFQKENLGDCLFINQLDCLTKKEAEELLLFFRYNLRKSVLGGSLKKGLGNPEQLLFLSTAK